jgi:hypothetical protein
MFLIDVLLLFDGLHDEVDCRHHGKANDCQEKQYLSRFAEHVFLHRREGVTAEDKWLASQRY